jgi:hypothetical protein
MSEVTKPVEEKTVWQCQLTPKETPVTVAVIQDLVCSGPHSPKLDSEKIKIIFSDKKFDYSLYVLGKGNTDYQSLTIPVTSYKAGSFDKPQFIISDGENNIHVEDLSWTIESVLESKEDKPVPSLGPFELTMPWWYWWSVGVGLLILLLFLFFRIKKIWVRKKLIEELKNHATALTPFNQFNKDLRAQVRSWQQSELVKSDNQEPISRKQIIESTEKIFRQFLMRELLVPALEWSDSDIYLEIKRRHPKIYKEHLLDIKKTFHEVREALKEEKKLTYLDCEQLITMVKKTSEKVHEIKSLGES